MGLYIPSGSQNLGLTISDATEMYDYAYSGTATGPQGKIARNGSRIRYWHALDSYRELRGVSLGATTAPPGAIWGNNNNGADRLYLSDGATKYGYIPYRVLTWEYGRGGYSDGNLYGGTGHNTNIYGGSGSNNTDNRYLGYSSTTSLILLDVSFKRTSWSDGAGTSGIQIIFYTQNPNGSAANSTTLWNSSGNANNPSHDTWYQTNYSPTSAHNRRIYAGDGSSRWRFYIWIDNQAMSLRYRLRFAVAEDAYPSSRLVW